MPSRVSILSAWALALCLLASPAHARFESQSGDVDRIDETHLAIHLIDDNGGHDPLGRQRAWWYVQLDDLAQGVDTVITVDGLGYEEAFLPVYSYDQEHWMHVPEKHTTPINAETLRIALPFTRRRAWIARRHPYTSHEQQELVDVVERAGATRDALDARVEVLGHSHDGHPIDVITITDRSPASNKRRAWVQAREHPGEPQGSWVADGMVRFLLSNDEAARAVRSAYIMHVAPMLNVDGVTRGNYRFNAHGENVDVGWGEEAPPLEVGLVQNFIIETSQQGPPYAVALNLHSSHVGQFQPPFASPHFGPQGLGYRADEATLWGKQIFYASAVQDIYAPRGFHVSRGSPTDFAPRNRNFLRRSSPETWWWTHYGEDVMALRIAAVDGQVGLEKRWSDVDDWRALGAALASALIAHEP